MVKKTPFKFPTERYLNVVNVDIKIVILIKNFKKALLVK